MVQGTAVSKTGNHQTRIYVSGQFNNSFGANFIVMVLVRLHRLEIFIGLFLMVSACYDYLCRDDYFYFFFLPQSIMYLAVGFQFIGLNVSD
jgi:hypothetical protein